jgi:type IV pilus assembly protein PilM
VAVKKAKVTDYMSVVEQAGLTPSVVDVDGFALGNQFEKNFPGEDSEAVALIDIGASIMKTNVLRAGATIFARDIPFGGTTTRRPSRRSSTSRSSRPRRPSWARTSA